MNKLSEKYFTIGEFASLFKLSKQTLFYYERNNILRPAYIDENGYRYYSLEQYFIFDIIINMRKLGIPLKDIAAYLQTRIVSVPACSYCREYLDVVLVVAWVEDKSVHTSYLQSLEQSIVR